MPVSHYLSRIALVLVIIGCLIGSGLYLGFFVPEGMPICYQSLVCDEAGLLTQEQISRLEDYHRELQARYEIDLRVVTTSVSEANAIQKYFNTAKVGELSAARKGTLLLIDPKNNKVRLEISAGLDVVFTDGFIAYLQQRQMLPFFQANRVADGILATTELMVARAQEAEQNHEFIAPDQLPENLAIGAGAEYSANIGDSHHENSINESNTNDELTLTQPEAVIAAYHQALTDKNSDATLPLYSEATQALRKQWVVTPAQMANELKMYQNCQLDKVIINKEKGWAVVRYQVDQRVCAPYFLVWEREGWRLDLVTMMQNVRFNIDNHWHFDMAKALPYADAFLDWSFNKNGYPFPHVKMRWGLTVETDYRTNTTFVKKIHPDTPAALMALQEGDVILKWDNQEHPDYRQIIESMDALEAGYILTVTVKRNEIELTIQLTAPPKV